jgi:hypothetical protein
VALTTRTAIKVVTGMARTRPMEPTSVRMTSSDSSALVRAVRERTVVEHHDDEDRKGGAGVGKSDGVHGGGDVVAADPHGRAEKNLRALVLRRQFVEFPHGR